MARCQTCDTTAHVPVAMPTDGRLCIVCTSRAARQRVCWRKPTSLCGAAMKTQATRRRGRRIIGDVRRRISKGVSFGCELFETLIDVSLLSFSPGIRLPPTEALTAVPAKVSQMPKTRPAGEGDCQVGQGGRGADPVLRTCGVRRRRRNLRRPSAAKRTRRL